MNNYERLKSLDVFGMTCLICHLQTGCSKCPASDECGAAEPGSWECRYILEGWLMQNDKALFREGVGYG